MPRARIAQNAIDCPSKFMLRAFFLHIGVVDRASAKHNYRRKAEKVAREFASLAVVFVPRVAKQLHDMLKLAYVEPRKQFKRLFGDILLIWGGVSI